MIDSNGDEVGVTTGSRGDKAYVDPDPGLAESVLSTLGWSDIDEDDYALDQDDVEAGTDEEVRLKP